jgi:hypothetical protein
MIASIFFIRDSAYDGVPIEVKVAPADRAHDVYDLPGSVNFDSQRAMRVVWGIRFVPILTLVVSGCGAIRPTIEYTRFGEADPERDRSVVNDVRQSYEAPPPSAQQVAVLVDTIPEGLDVGTGQIKVVDGYQHQLVGKFQLTHASRAGSLSLWWFSDYESDWRRGYCYPQVVLTLATLMIWSMTPLAVPCWGDPRMTKVDAIAYARRIATAAGGDLVIMGYGRRFDSELILDAAGIILRADPRMKRGELKSVPAKVPLAANGETM